jgi:hypothetical protein
MPQESPCAFDRGLGLIFYGWKYITCNLVRRSAFVEVMVLTEVLVVGSNLSQGKVGRWVKVERWVQVRTHVELFYEV